MSAVLVILVALLVVAGIGLCVFKPKYAIVPVLMLFPAEQILMGYIPDLRWQYGWATNVVVGSIALFGVAYRFFRGQRIFQGMNNRVFWCFAFFYLYIGVSLLWTPSRESALYFLNQSWAYFVLFYLITPLLTKDLDDLESLCVPTMVVGVAIMALMLVNPNGRFINDRYTIDLGYAAGIGEIQSNPLAIADAGAILAITAAIYRPNERNPLIMLLRVAGVLLGLALALLSGSRGQVLASVLVIAVALPFVNRSRNAVRTVGSLMTVGVIVGFLYFVYQTFVASSGQSRWEGHGTVEGLGMRFEMAGAALSAYGSSPAFWPMGLGASAFNVFYTYRPHGFLHLYPHNILVESITEYGIPGLVLFGAIVWYTIKNCMRLVEFAGDSRSRRTTAFVFAGILIFQFLMAMKQGSLLGMPQFFMFALIVAAVVKNEELALAKAYYEGEMDGYEDEEVFEGDGNAPAWGSTPEPRTS